MIHSPGPFSADRFHITIMAAPVVLWFRQDLRLADNRALVTANRTGAPVIAIYILHDETRSGHATGEASRWWLHHSRTALAHDLKQRDHRLLLRRGDPFDVLTSIIRNTGASGLYFNCCYDPHQRKLENQISEHLASEISIHPFASSLLFDPETIHTRKYAHAPWQAPGDILRNAGVNLGKHYPRPVVDHAACRQRALDAYRQVKNREAR